MSEALVIRLSDDPAAAQSVLVDASGGRLGAVIAGPLAQAAPLALGRRVIAVAPAVDVVLAEPELPAKNAVRLAQLAPYALEELLATDIESMHFAVGKRAASGKTPVAAVLRERIERWLAELSAADLHPDALYSEASLLPIAHGGVTLLLDRNRLYVQHAGAPGFALDAQPLQDAVQLAFARDEESSAAEFVGDVQFYVTQSDYDAQEQAIASLRERFPGLQIKLLPEGPLPLFATQAVHANQSGNAPVNLLSGPYERKSSFSASLAPWRIAAALLIAAVALQLIYGGLRLWQTARIERQVDAQIRDIATQTLPGIRVTDTRDVRRQFEARLGAARQAGGRGDLLSSLAALGDALKAAEGTRIEALSYRTQTIDVRVTAPSVDALDKIQQAATSSGLNTQIQSATPRDNKVEGRLQLKL